MGVHSLMLGCSCTGANTLEVIERLMRLTIEEIGACDCLDNPIRPVWSAAAGQSERGGFTIIFYSPCELVYNR